MTTQLPSLRTKYGEGIGVELFFEFPEISENEKTFLDADSAAGASSVSAAGVNFNANDYVVIGQPGNERTEIAQVQTASASTITFVGTLVFAHNRGDVIRFIPYNQIAAEYSTDSGVNFNTITAVGIRADSTETYMQRASDLSTYIYRFRFTNATTGLFSPYSGQASATGYADNTLWSVKTRALSQLGEQRGSLIDDQFLNDSVIEARRQADKNPAIFRWSFREKFGVNAATLLAGQWKITAPTDLRDPNTYKNILGIRMGSQNRPCVYQDRVRFNQNYLNVSHTSLAAIANFGDATLTLTSSNDFDSSGAVTLPTGVAGSGLVIVSYTGNNKATSTLTGVTGIPAAGIANASEVWQRATFGLPTAYTIDAGVIYFDVPLIARWDSQNVHMDYYTIIPTMNQDSDQFDEDFWDLYVYFLKWKIASLKANGKLDRNSNPDYQDWISGLGNLIGQQVSGQMINFVPDIEGFLSSVG